jgi:hypothetical protein
MDSFNSGLYVSITYYAVPTHQSNIGVALTQRSVSLNEVLGFFRESKILKILTEQQCSLLATSTSVKGYYPQSSVCSDVWINTLRNDRFIEVNGYYFYIFTTEILASKINAEQSKCELCYDNQIDTVVRHCGHRYCSTCYFRYLIHNDLHCAYCNERIPTDKTIQEYDMGVEIDSRFEGLLGVTHGDVNRAIGDNS